MLSPTFITRLPRLLFWLVVGIALVVLVGDAASLIADGVSARAWGALVKSTGNLAWQLLICTIFIGLLHKLFPTSATLARLLPLRKDAGVLAFFLAVAHLIAACLRVGLSWTEPIAILGYAFEEPALAAGTLSFLIMLPLAATSTVWAVRTMGGTMWKRLQRLAHIAFILAALHVAFIGHGEMGPLVILGVYAAGYAWLFTRTYLDQRTARLAR